MNLQIAHQAVLRWFESFGRDLPWREKNNKQNTDSLHISDTRSSWFNSSHRDPYKVLVSELMLQQTQVERVLPKYLEFINRWGSAKQLASAPLSEILIAWQGLGYNRRAKYLHQSCRIVAEKYDGFFPDSEEKLLDLPGIGKYTARAILAFAFQKDVGVSDTNIQRIFSRAWFGKETAEVGGNSKELWELIDQSVPKGKGDPWSQALMDLGALACKASAPLCLHCPLQSLCAANQIAINAGFKSYAEYLKQTKTKKDSQITNKIKFEDTDRFFRGRVIDHLRKSNLHMDELKSRMQLEHGLSDLSRWGRIVEQLMIDGLIQIRGSIVSLPDEA